MRMHNPPHPGELLRELWLTPMGLSITDDEQYRDSVRGRSKFRRVQHARVGIAASYIPQPARSGLSPCPSKSWNFSYSACRPPTARGCLIS